MKRSIALLALLMLAACTNNNAPTPTSDSILTYGDIPKAVVTIDITATPALMESPTAAPLASPAPEEELAFLPPTATPTPYVGVFIGQPTSIGPDGQVILPPTLPPLNIGAPGNANLPPVGVISTGAASGGNCSIAVASVFQNAYVSNPGVSGLGCPRDGGVSTTLVYQPFERGRMFWRDTRQILIMNNAQSYWRIPDSWNEGIPADDPNFAPPAPNLYQPVRGFGFAWRGNETFRNTLGWAVGPEIPLSSYWQEFEGGSLFIGDNGLIYAIPIAESGQFIGGITP